VFRSNLTEPFPKLFSVVLICNPDGIKVSKLFSYDVMQKGVCYKHAGSHAATEEINNGIQGDIITSKSNQGKWQLSTAANDDDSPCVPECELRFVDVGKSMFHKSDAPEVKEIHPELRFYPHKHCFKSTNLRNAAITDAVFKSHMLVITAKSNGKKHTGTVTLLSDKMLGGMYAWDANEENFLYWGSGMLKTAEHIAQRNLNHRFSYNAQEHADVYFNWDSEYGIDDIKNLCSSIKLHELNQLLEAQSGPYKLHSVHVGLLQDNKMVMKQDMSLVNGLTGWSCMLNTVGKKKHTAQFNQESSATGKIFKKRFIDPYREKQNKALQHKTSGGLVENLHIHDVYYWYCQFISSQTEWHIDPKTKSQAYSIWFACSNAEVQVKLEESNRELFGKVFQMSLKTRKSPIVKLQLHCAFKNNTSVQIVHVVYDHAKEVIIQQYVLSSIETRNQTKSTTIISKKFKSNAVFLRQHQNYDSETDLKVVVQKPNLVTHDSSATSQVHSYALLNIPTTILETNKLLQQFVVLIGSENNKHMLSSIAMNASASYMNGIVQAAIPKMKYETKKISELLPRIESEHTVSVGTYFAFGHETMAELQNEMQSATVQYQEKPATLEELGNLCNYVVKLHLLTDKGLTIYQGILVKKHAVNKQNELLFCYTDTDCDIHKTVSGYGEEYNSKLYIIHAGVVAEVAEVHPLWYVKYGTEYAEQKEVILQKGNVQCKIVDVDAHDFDHPYLLNKNKPQKQWVSEKEIASVSFGDITNVYNAGQHLSGYEPKSKRSHVNSAICWPYQMHMMWNELKDCWYGGTHDVHRKGKIVAHAPFYQVQKRKANISTDCMRLTDLGDVINQLPIAESENDIFGQGGLKGLIDDLNQGQRRTLQRYLIDSDKKQRFEHSWMDWIFEAAFTATYNKDKQKGLLDAMHIQRVVSCHRKNILKYVIPDFAFHPKTYFQFPSSSPFFKNQSDETKTSRTEKVWDHQSAEFYFDRYIPPVYLGKSAHSALQAQLQKIDQARKEFLEGTSDTYNNCVVLTQNLFQYDINEFHIDSDRAWEKLSKNPEKVSKISEKLKKNIAEFEEFMTTYQNTDTSGVSAQDKEFPWKVARESGTQATMVDSHTNWRNKTSSPFYNSLSQWITHYHWPDNGIKTHPKTFANMYTKYRDFYKDRSAMLMQWTRGHNVFQTSGIIVPMIRLHTEADHTKLIEFLNKRIEWLNKENKNNEHQGHMHEAVDRVDCFRPSGDGKGDLLTVEMLEKDMQRMHDDKCKYVCFLRNQGQKSSWWSGKSYTDIMAYYMTNQFMNDGDDIHDMAGYDQNDSIEKKLGTMQGAQRDYMYKNDLLFMFSGLVQLSACAQVIDVKTLAKAQQANKQSMYIVRAGVMSS